eukprot:1039110-Prymnesium_polylepis.1
MPRRRAKGTRQGGVLRSQCGPGMLRALEGALVVLAARPRVDDNVRAIGRPVARELVEGRRRRVVVRAVCRILLPAPGARPARALPPQGCVASIRRVKREPSTWLAPKTAAPGPKTTPVPWPAPVPTTAAPVPKQPRRRQKRPRRSSLRRRDSRSCRP